MGKLDGKVTLIVGATSGIGQSSAELFGKEGATVIVTGRRTEKGEKIVADIVSKGGTAEFHKLDCSVLSECYDTINYVVKKHGKLDVLYYNAAATGPGDSSFESVTEDSWDEIFTTNLKNAFFMTQKALPHLKIVGGKVIYTASNGGICPNAVLSAVPYGISKAALIHATKIIALTVANTGVRVNAIAPGLTLTEILGGVPKDVQEKLAANIPVGHICQPEDMAAVALLLASGEAECLTGQTIVVDGGMSLL